MKRFLLCIFVCVGIAGCKSPKSFSPELSKEEITSEEHNQQKMVDDVMEKGGVPKPWRNRKNMRKQFEEVGERVEKAGAEVCVELKLQKKGCYYYFILSRSEDVNAASDGKNISVNTGMMRFVESDDELAVVMAHEVAHNLMGHVRAQSENATIGKVLGAAVDIMATSQGISTGGGMASVGSDIAVGTYSVEFEKEADYIGMYILARAGYELKKAPELWRRMSIDDAEGIYNGLTHPSNAERSVALQKAIYEIEYKRKNKIKLLPDFKTQ